MTWILVLLLVNIIAMMIVINLTPKDEPLFKFWVAIASIIIGPCVLLSAICLFVTFAILTINDNLLKNKRRYESFKDFIEEEWGSEIFVSCDIFGVVGGVVIVTCLCAAIFGA